MPTDVSGEGHTDARPLWSLIIGLLSDGSLAQIRESEPSTSKQTTYRLRTQSRPDTADQRFWVGTPVGDRAARPEDRATVIIGRTDR